MSLSNKVVVITGGAKGIGFEISNKFLHNNAKVVIILDINENDGIKAITKLNKTYGNARAVFMKCDVTKDLHHVYDDIIASYEKVDVLVNNAGIFDESRVKETIDINVLAVIDWSVKFYEHMRKDRNGKGGTIMNMSSICGFQIFEYAPIYQASKFAVFGFTKCLGHAMNYNRTGVRVVGICPGFTDTGFLEEAKPWDVSTTEEFLKYLPKQDWQNMDVVGDAAVEIYEKATSGSLWVIAGGKPIYEVGNYTNIS